jgi:hypothetical protein
MDLAWAITVHSNKIKGNLGSWGREPNPVHKIYLSFYKSWENVERKLGYTVKKTEKKRLRGNKEECEKRLRCERERI